MHPSFLFFTTGKRYVFLKYSNWPLFQQYSKFSPVPLIYIFIFLFFLLHNWTQHINRKILHHNRTKGSFKNIIYFTILNHKSINKISERKLHKYINKIVMYCYEELFLLLATCYVPECKTFFIKSLQANRSSFCVCAYCMLLYVCRCACTTTTAGWSDLGQLSLNWNTQNKFSLS